ncbi:hypothetical protein [Sulfuricurvum sp.]|uniref:hypothetical protein n=1 Tax=Sulfuricurvum sp. TaxID=2025608 RepID=UPI002620521F|nr:hypothetical protein [Sulfuricurvum sp.]MDD3595349.1 hypothetical protein [Sulfuricurvum sp.]
MTYIHWFQTHAEKHRRILSRLSAQNLSPDQIVAYFTFEKMVEKEKDFCQLYATKRKCHDIPNLNCYWCACPYFRFNDNAQTDTEGIVVYSYCAINAPAGKPFRHENSIHHDCSDCTIPHDPDTILKKFSVDWNMTMKACNLTF